MTTDEGLYPANRFRNRNGLTREKYDQMYMESLRSPEEFWSQQAQRLSWTKPWSEVCTYSFTSPVHISWFKNATLNASYNCVDRHLKSKGDQRALIWEPDNPSEEAKVFTFNELHEEVVRFAKALKSIGVKKGDRVTLYMPMIPETIFALLACARIGAPHSVVFGGFSPESLASRIRDCDSRFVITADGGYRAGKIVPLKKNVDEALRACPDVSKTLVIRRVNTQDLSWKTSRDVWYHEISTNDGRDCPPEEVDSEHPLFLLYTSGSTGQPKGVLHTTGGYLLYASTTHEYTFDIQPDDVFWCTADVGWITGHSYVTYGPLLNGVTTLIHEGVPTYPSASRHWEIIDKHKVTIYYTAPTAIRSLMRSGDDFLLSTKRDSLRLLGSVGEPINPEAWRWYFDSVGMGKCPVVDTWWQTETGGIMITPLPGVHALKPGAATLPFFGVQPVLVDENGKELKDRVASGKLCLKGSWPGQMRTVYKDHARFEQTYFSTFPGLYFTGDGARRDQDGYFWITGRVDDVLNCSGHRLGTAEIESALVLHPEVTEAAVVGFPHDIKGQGIYCYVTTKESASNDQSLSEELKALVRKEIGPVATPDRIQFTAGLPKTRSGKIMRRILRKIASGEVDSLGDTSTLAEPAVVSELLKGARTF